jgi:hypothetical protein
VIAAAFAGKWQHMPLFCRRMIGWAAQDAQALDGLQFGGRPGQHCQVPPAHPSVTVCEGRTTVREGVLSSLAHTVANLGLSLVNE